MWKNIKYFFKHVSIKTQKMESLGKHFTTNEGMSQNNAKYKRIHKECKLYYQKLIIILTLLSSSNRLDHSLCSPMKTSFYDRIMLEDECKAITRTYEQSLVVENVTFNTKTEHNFITSRNSNRAVRTSRRRYIQRPRTSKSHNSELKHVVLY